MKCECGYKKDWTEADGIPLKCPKCGAEAGTKFDIHEVPVSEKDNRRNWLPWIIRGSLVGGGLIIGLIVYFWNRNKDKG